MNQPTNPTAKRLSANFRLKEFLRSQTAARNSIDMTPPPSVLANLERLAKDVLQPLRDNIGRLDVSSGYRPEALNALIGGSTRSAHIDGRAADIEATDLWPINIANCARQLMERGEIAVDQLIIEFGHWVHISIAPPGETPRGQVLTAMRKDGKVVYVPGLQQENV
jgi:zinc D-Ala-D-Ala carboxypeptidase